MKKIFLILIVILLINSISVISLSTADHRYQFEGGGNTDTGLGSLTLTNSGVSGTSDRVELERAINCDGGDVMRGNSGFEKVYDNITVSFWIKINSKTSGTIFSHKTTNANSVNTIAFDFTNNQTSIHTTTGQDRLTIIDIDADSFVNDWKHMIYSWSHTGTGRIWVDGVEQVYNDSDTHLFQDHDEEFRICANVNPIDVDFAFIDAKVDDFNIWFNTSISQEEITTFYNNYFVGCSFSCSLFDSCQANITGGKQDCIVTNQTDTCVYTGNFSEFQTDCNYCTAEESQSSPLGCLDFIQTIHYTLDNNATCCQLTGNNTDCETSSSFNQSCSYIAQYESSDLPIVVVDGVGTGFVATVVLMSLIVTVSLLAFVFGKFKLPKF